MPVEVIFGKHANEATMTYGTHVQKLKEMMQHAQDIVCIHHQNAGRNQKLIYDDNIKSNCYEIDDIVWLENFKGQSEVPPKPCMSHEGPHMVCKKVGTLDYELHLSNKKWKAVQQN